MIFGTKLYVLEDLIANNFDVEDTDFLLVDQYADYEEMDDCLVTLLDSKVVEVNEVSKEPRKGFFSTTNFKGLKNLDKEEDLSDDGAFYFADRESVNTIESSINEIELIEDVLEEVEPEDDDEDSISIYEWIEKIRSLVSNATSLEELKALRKKVQKKGGICQ